MKALCWHGKGDMRYDTVPDPKIEHPRDAIIKVTACAICGSDLHLYDGVIPDHGERRRRRPRDDGRGRRGRRGEQEAEGRRPGRRALHDRLRRMLLLHSAAFSRAASAPTPTRPEAEKLWGHSPAGLFGYSHLLGGYAGGQAEYLRVPYRRCRTHQGAGRAHRRAGAVPVRHLSDRLHGGRVLQYPARRHDCRLGLRPGRPVRDHAAPSCSAPSGSSPSTRCRSGWRWPKPPVPRRSIS